MIKLNLEMRRANFPRERMYENVVYFVQHMYSMAHSYAILDLQSRSVALKSRSLVNDSHSLQSWKERLCYVADAKEILA